MSCNFLRTYSSLTLFFLLINSCGFNTPSNKNFSKPKYAGNSFVVSIEDSTNLKEFPENTVGIKKSSLKKELLFQGSMILQAVVGQFNNLKSRVVLFKKRGDSFYMMESPKGDTISHDLPQNFILA